MLPLKNFSLAKPLNIQELKVQLAQAHSATKLIAGGTDLLPNLKHGLYDLTHMISLRHVKELNNLEIGLDNLKIGSNITLHELSINLKLKEVFPAIQYAASQIASPHLRRMGTVGGNICLDTRCTYFNQSEFWRKALGYCIKKDGDLCHVVKNGKRCVAASSNDLATILLAYDARLTIISSQQERVIDLSDFYTANGEKNNILEHHEVVTQVELKRTAHTRAGFVKLRHRSSIDFPLLSIGVVFTLNQNNKFESGRLVINALVAKPKIFELERYNTQIYNEDLIKIIAREAREKCHPQTNIAEDTNWRKEMIEYYTMLAFRQAHV